MISRYSNQICSTPNNYQNIEKKKQSPNKVNFGALIPTKIYVNSEQVLAKGASDQALLGLQTAVKVLHTHKNQEIETCFKQTYGTFSKNNVLPWINEKGETFILTKNEATKVKNTIKRKQAAILKRINRGDQNINYKIELDKINKTVNRIVNSFRRTQTANIHLKTSDNNTLVLDKIV